jgi:hypothetical protein
MQTSMSLKYEPSRSACERSSNNLILQKSFSLEATARIWPCCLTCAEFARQRWGGNQLQLIAELIAPPPLMVAEWIALPLLTVA